MADRQTKVLGDLDEDETGENAAIDDDYPATEIAGKSENFSTRFRSVLVTTK